MENNKLDDFIQQAVNKGYEESMLRMAKMVKYKAQLVNEKRNKLRKARKAERQNRKKGRK